MLPRILLTASAALSVIACLVLSGMKLAAPATAGATSERVEQAAPPATHPATLAELVPADVGIYIQFDQLAGHMDHVQSGEFYARLQRFPLLATWMSESGLNAGSLLDQVAESLRVPPEAIREKLLGKQVVLAAWPPSEPPADAAAPGQLIPGQDVLPGQDGELTGPEVLSADAQGLLLIDAEDPQVVDDVARALFEAQRRSGELVSAEKVNYAGATYHVRRLGDPEQPETVYLAAVGTIGIMTASETAMRRVLDLHAGNVNEQLTPLSDSANYQEALTRLSVSPMMTVFVNPRPWDAVMVHSLPEETAQTEFIRAVVSQAWSASNYWVLGLDVQGRVALESFLHVDREKLSGPVRDFFTAFTGQAEPMNRVPANAVMATAGHVDLGGLAQLFLRGGDQLGLENLDALRDLTQGLLLGLDLFDDVLPELGPGMEVHLARGESEENPAGGFVVSVQTKERDPSDPRPSAAEALDAGLYTGMNVAAAMASEAGGDQASARVVVDTIGRTQVTSLEGADLLPEGLVATYALLDDYVIIGTRREAVAEAVLLEPRQSLAQSPLVRQFLAANLANPSQLFYVDCVTMRQVLDTQPEFVIELASRARGLDRETALKSVSELRSMLELSEMIVSAVRFDSEGVALSVVFSMDPPGSQVVRTNLE